jgi:hypothetical protein
LTGGASTSQLDDIEHQFRMAQQRIRAQTLKCFVKQDRFYSRQQTDLDANLCNPTPLVLSCKFIHLPEERCDERSFMHGA